MSELTPAQTPRAPIEANPVFFSRADQCPSAAVSDMVSFGGSEDEILDDSVSLAASDGEELSGLIYAVDELGLEWSPAEEPTRSRLDEWFLPGCRQTPLQ